MGLLKNGRVNIVITSRYLRYSYHKNMSLEGLHDHGEMELPRGAIVDGKIENRPALLDAVTKLVKKKKWRREKLYFCVPDDTVVIRELQIPVSLTKEEALGYVKTQIGTAFYLPFTNPALAIDILDLDEDNQKQNILIYAYPKEQITAFEELFKEAGLKPIAADLTTLSVYRYYYLQHPEENQHILLTHWNTDALVVTAFNQHKAVFSRYIRFDRNVGEELDDKEMDESRASEIINDTTIEVARIIDFYQFSITKGEAAITQLILSGDFPYIEAARKALSNSTEIPIHDYEKDEITLELPTKYIDVLGLALKKNA